MVVQCDGSVGAVIAMTGQTGTDRGVVECFGEDATYRIFVPVPLHH